MTQERPNGILAVLTLLASACGGAGGPSNQGSAIPTGGAAASGETAGADVGIGIKRNPSFASGPLPAKMIWLAPSSCSNHQPDHNPEGLAPFEHAGQSNVDTLLLANLCNEVPRVDRRTTNDLDRQWHAGPNLTEAIARFSFRQIKGSPGSLVAAVRDANGPNYTVVVFGKDGTVLYIDRKFPDGAKPNDDELRHMMETVPAAGPT
jgi:hypothetical protein